MPLTLSLREQIVNKLLDSGRFLMAEVTSESFYFDPAEPLDLTIRVREYEGITLLNEKTPAKPASNPHSVKDIVIEEEWDLDD